MAESTHSAQASGWRISKACQECRKRKIKCNGDQPCKTCHLRNTQCVYRDVIRQRRKKGQEHPDSEGLAPNNGSSRPEYGGERQDSPALLQESSRRREMSISLNNSVSATHMTSPSCKMQLYYGSTSHFALMHEIYRDLVSNGTNYPAQGPHGRVEEVGAGLDMFSFRSIFFGTPTDASSDPTRGGQMHLADPQIMFLPYELANIFLERFLSTTYYLLRFWSPESFHRRLEQLYSPSLNHRTDKWSQGVLLMALAMGSLGTDHYAWGDVMFERVKATCNSSFDDVVNLQTVQLSMFMISYAHFQSEQGRPNSSFLYLGTAARKAISAGLHKDSPNEKYDNADSVHERRLTFWALYFYETWVCFHLGRPSSLLRRDVGIQAPEDSFMLALDHLAKGISRSANELYGQHHDSLLQMWRLARSIVDDIRCFDSKMQCALGFGLDKTPQLGGVGVQQTMFTTLYHHIILLTFRPFLIFRGRWNHDMKSSSQQLGKPKREIPPWLNEACNRALSAACKTIHYLCESFAVNELVRGIHYHGFFLSSSCFALIFDLIHGQDLAATHLPWIHLSLQALFSMRRTSSVNSSIIAIQTVLRKIDPSYEWTPRGETGPQGYNIDQTAMTTRQPAYDIPTAQDSSTTVVEPWASERPFAEGIPILPELQTGLLPEGMRTGGSGSVASGEDLLDFTQSDMGWDFDFSTMDLETFFNN